MSTPYVEEPRVRGSVVLQDVTVVDTLDGVPTAHQDVRLDDGVVTAVTTTGRADRDATVIDLPGRFVVPGFVDAHGHPLNEPDRAEGAYALMLANGVVGYRQMSGTSRLLADRAAGRLPAFAGAPQLLATCGDLLTPLNAGTPDAARATVARQAQQGADFVKAALTSHDGHIAALEEGRRIGIPVVGHLPDDVDPRLASALGMRSIEHLGPGAAVFEAAARQTTGAPGPGSARSAPRPPRLPAVPGLDRIFGRVLRNIVVNPSARMSADAAGRTAAADATYAEERARDLARVFAENETWQTPTLIRMHTQQFPDAPEHAHDPRTRYIAPPEVARWRRTTRKFLTQPESTRAVLRAHWDAQLRLTRIFAEEHVPLLAGSDFSGAGWVIPGFALHDELDLLALAGLSPLHVLRTATINPARFLGRGDVAGRVAPGWHADLVVLDGDPLTDHRNLHRIAGVVRGGGWWSRHDLDEVLARVEADPRTV